MKNFALIIALVLAGVCANAQETAKKQVSIFQRLGLKDSISGGYIKFYHDPRFEKVVIESRSVTQVTVNGFRVQVFSSNNQKTAKDKAFSLESELKEVFPEVPIYVSYTSPFWKVRMGDFTNMEAAQHFRRSLLEIFPELKSDAYTVRDQVIPSRNN